MADMVTISCILNTTDASVPLGFEAWINDYKFFDTEHVTGQQQVFVEINDNDAEQELRFVMKNKLPSHTQIDSQGNIVSDARLILTDLTFDEISLGNLVSENTVYTHDQNAQLQTPIQDKFYSEIGCNGTVSLKFTTPMYLWLLEHL
jgi:predicted GNAT family N-acyltransferase